MGANQHFVNQVLCKLQSSRFKSKMCPRIGRKFRFQKERTATPDGDEEKISNNIGYQFENQN